MGVGCCNVGQVIPFFFCFVFFLLLPPLPPREGREKEQEVWRVRSMVVLGDRSVVWIQIKQINSRRGVLKPKHSLRASRFSERFCFRCETPPPPPRQSPSTSSFSPRFSPPGLLASTSCFFFLFFLRVCQCSPEATAPAFLLQPTPLSKDPPTKTHI